MITGSNTDVIGIKIIRRLKAEKDLNARNALLSTLLMLSLLVSCSGKADTEESRSLHEAEVLKQLELKAISAEFRLDTAWISQVMHDDFVAVYPQKLQNKREELSGIYNSRIKAQHEGDTMDSLYLDDFHARFYNGRKTAIVTFYTVSRGQRKGVSYNNERWRWYDVWVKESAAWKLVSIQGTPVN